MKTRSRLQTRLAGGAATIATLVLASTVFVLEPASAVTAGAQPASSDATASAIPQPPSQGAPLSQWQAWAALQQSGIQSTDWSQVLESQQCDSTSVSIVPVTSIGAVSVPAGIVTDAVSFTANCSPASGQAGSVSPDTSSYCPFMTNYDYGGIYAGTACVGTLSISGTTYIGAAYTYQSSGSTYGHTELGQSGTPCNSGSTVANGSPETTLSNGQTAGVFWGPKTSSADWSSTWWQDNGGGSYSDFGSICGNY